MFYIHFVFYILPIWSSNENPKSASMALNTGLRSLSFKLIASVYSSLAKSVLLIFHDAIQLTECYVGYMISIRNGGYESRYVYCFLHRLFKLLILQSYETCDVSMKLVTFLKFLTCIYYFKASMFI
ncbi:hypothetical protein Hdeb2414_s0003g00087611 [Helianthus debilis subsp. tardiflorus]